MAAWRRYGAPHAGQGLLAAAPAANAVTSGTTYFATNVGPHGTLLQSNGTRWRGLNGAPICMKLADPVTGITNTPVIALQALFPIGLLQAGDMVLFDMTTSKSGTTDSCGLTCRWGTAGTTADGIITGWSSQTYMGASNVSGGGQQAIRIVSTTSIAKVGNNTASAASYTTPAGTGAAAAATTALPDSAANALYLSVVLFSTGASNTVDMTSGRVTLATP